MIILLSGKCGNGKDTIADYLVTNYNYSKYSFAETLKHHTSQKYNFDPVLCFTQEGKKTTIGDKTVRDLLISEALEIRKTNDNYFVEKTVSKFQKGTDIVISDCRYPNEIEYITKAFKDVIVLRVNKSDQQNPTHLLPSETQLDNYQFDYIIDNDGSMESLYNSVSVFLSKTNP